METLPVLISLLLASAFPMAGVITIKPNRVSPGEARYLLELGYAGWVAPALFLLVALAVIAGMVTGSRGRTSGAHLGGEHNATQLRRRRVPLLLWAITLTVLPWIMVTLAAGRAAALGELGGIARFTPGAGTVLTMLAAVAAWHELNRTARSHRIAGVLLVTVVIVVAILLVSGAWDSLAYVVEYRVRAERFWREARRHWMLAGTAVAVASGIGVPAGMVAFRYPRIRESILGITSTIQTVPSLAMFGLLIAPLAALSRAMPQLRALGIAGVGTTPALIALTLYALLPVVRNTLTALAFVPLDVRESGRAMGMQRRQQFWIVEVPLALPIVLRGVHTAAVQAVGNTTVAALIGAGGFGWFIFQGLGQAADDLVVLGVIPIVAMAVIVDRFFLVLHKTVDWRTRT